MPQYKYQPEESSTGRVSRIVIEPSYVENEEFPGSVSVMFVDSEDKLVDVWSADSLTQAADLLKRYGSESGYTLEKVDGPKEEIDEGTAPDPPWPMGGDVGGV